MFAAPPPAGTPVRMIRVDQTFFRYSLVLQQPIIALVARAIGRYLAAALPPETTPLLNAALRPPVAHGWAERVAELPGHPTGWRWRWYRWWRYPIEYLDVIGCVDHRYQCLLTIGGASFPIADEAGLLYALAGRSPIAVSELVFAAAGRDWAADEHLFRNAGAAESADAPAGVIILHGDGTALSESDLQLLTEAFGLSDDQLRRVLDVGNRFGRAVLARLPLAEAEAACAAARARVDGAGLRLTIHPSRNPTPARPD